MYYGLRVAFGSDQCCWALEDALAGRYDGLLVRYFWPSTFVAVHSSTIISVYEVDAVESCDFEWAKSKQACTRQACFMKKGAIAISARSDALVAMFA